MCTVWLRPIAADSIGIIENSTRFACNRCCLCRQCFCNGGLINSTKLLHSTQQHEVDAALTAFLGPTSSLEGQTAIPNAESDMEAITCQLDSLIAPQGMQACMSGVHSCQAICMQIILTDQKPLAIFYTVWT